MPRSVLNNATRRLGCFSPHIRSTRISTPHLISSLQFPHLPKSSILEQADLTSSGHIIRVQFNLASPECVVQQNSKHPIRITTDTPCDLVQGLKSLSTALSFDVYIRQSDYAIGNLNRLNQQLCNNAISLSPIKLVGLFKGRDAIPIKWPSLESDNQHQILQEKPPPPPPLYKEAREMSLDREAAAFDTEGLENKIDLDEEYYTALHARELSPAIEIALATEITSDSTRLSSEFTDWLVGATTIHSDIYTHRSLASRLNTLGYYIRTQNTKAFHSTMIWCSTILFYDPLDSGSIPKLWNGLSRSLISNVARIIRWSNTSCRSLEVCLSYM